MTLVIIAQRQSTTCKGTLTETWRYRKTEKSSKQEKRESEVTLDTLLKSIGLENHTSQFQDEKVDLKLILDLSEDDMRRLLVDFNIKWGDRYRFEKAIKDVKDRKPIETIENNQDSTIQLASNVDDTLQSSGENLLKEHTELSAMDIQIGDESSDAPINLIEVETEPINAECSLCETAEK